MQLIIITGANRGLGYALLKQLTLRLKTPTKIIATSRDANQGKTAIDSVLEATQAKRSKDTTLEHCLLDITDKGSITNFVSHIKTTYGPDCVNVLVNNAGFLSSDEDSTGSITEKTINTNYFGTSNLTTELSSLFANNSRVIFLSSTLCKAVKVPDEFQLSYYYNNYTTKEAIDINQLEIIEEAKKGLIQNTFPSPAYLSSKGALVALAKVLAEKFKAGPKCILFVSCCPGWVRTDMGGPSAPLSIEVGIKTPYYLVTDDFDHLYQYNGKLFTNCTVNNL
ncbi:hypothetical protein BB561_000583 [Smittium simulii]|uniref:Carbonyl reductase [NADPH] 1 n=1 Tax=Smittium simulii TaxID=133385 RepID=A0A2T9YYI7_9FUNG|nr:hypothetical protein BB561_000583 [Smittium simulii]